MLAGKYRVDRVLGVGGMGVVVAARHLELDEPVAVKFLLPHVPAQGEPVTRFLREARAAIKIRSDYVVRVLDVGRLETGAPYIVMEYLDGEDLARHCEHEGPMGIGEAVDAVLQATEAIAAAHALGIVHRDLKPANLFRTTAPDGSTRVKVLDFGISKIAEPEGEGPSSGLTSTATIMGTPCFMSPEQLRSTRDVDARTDLWSLGAILYALLTGAPPYDGESNADVSAKIIRDPAPPLRDVRKDVPEALDAVVARCLEKDRARRFASAADLARALADAWPTDAATAAAARIARIASAPSPAPLAPRAERSEPKVGGTATPRPGSAAMDDPTRTASAWGETKPEEKDTPAPRVPWGVVGLGAAALAAIIGIAATRGPGQRAAATGAATTASASALPATSAEMRPAALEAAPSAAASVAAAPPAAASTTARTGSAASAGATQPASARPAHPAASAAPSASAAPAATKPRGLFDDRE